jgi:hypothetical protein
MENKNKKIFFLIALGIGLLSLAFLFGHWLSKRSEIEKEVLRINENFQSSKRDVLKMINEKHNRRGAIGKINFLLEENDNSQSSKFEVKLKLEQEANLKIILAEAYIYNKKGEDFKKGINILKEVAKESNYPKKWRAMALERIALFSGARGEIFAKKNIFNDDFFSLMMQDGSLSLAQKRLYEESLTLDRSVMPYYRIADWYVSQLLFDDSDLSAEKKDEYLKASREFLKSGVDFFNNSYPKSPWDPERLIMAYQMYAEVATKLYLINEFDDSQKIIDSYDKAIAIYEKKYNIQKWPVAKDRITAPMLRMQLPPLIFSYASSLAIMQKPLSQDKTQEFLKILYDKDWQEEDSFGTFTLLKNENKSISANSYNRLKIISLAKADSNFTNLLIGMGWKSEQIQEIPVLQLGIQK